MQRKIKINSSFTSRSFSNSSFCAEYMQPAMGHQSDVRCANCHEPIETKSQFLNCGHMFHKHCIEEWASHGGKDCPLCRTSFSAVIVVDVGQLMVVDVVDPTNDTHENMMLEEDNDSDNDGAISDGDDENLSLNDNDAQDDIDDICDEDDMDDENDGYEDDNNEYGSGNRTTGDYDNDEDNIKDSDNENDEDDDTHYEDDDEQDEYDDEYTCRNSRVTMMNSMKMSMTKPLILIIGST